MNKKHERDPSTRAAAESEMPLIEDSGRINATPEQVAQAIFAAARTPDPTKRKQRNKRKRRVD